MKRLIITAALFAFATPVLAQTPSYNFVQLGYQELDLDDGGLGIDVDGDGFAGSGSFEVAENWHVLASFSNADFGSGVDLNQFSIGGGYHTDISQTTSFFTNLVWINAEIDTNFGNVDEDGFGLSVGVRNNLNNNVELEGAVSYADLGDGADGISVGGAAWYRFNNEFSIGLNAAFDDDVVGYGIAGRFYFGR
ncbi:MAG: hypothetical protein K0U72_09940 [Gammaproteobacteria bacterium]|nr:hypothetical protein [Gammaproteobacteria bacterium]